MIIKTLVNVIFLMSQILTKKHKIIIRFADTDCLFRCLHATYVSVGFFFYIILLKNSRISCTQYFFRQMQKPKYTDGALTHYTTFPDHYTTPSRRV